MTGIQSFCSVVPKTARKGRKELLS